MDPDSRRLRVSVTDGAGRPLRDGGLAVWLAATAPSRAAGEVAIALASDARVRTLNRRYRGRNKATDVLSFPNGDRDFNVSGIRMVGDIVIATGVARRQARAAGHSYQSELRVLALHGLLHLLGYDHHDRRDNGRMSRLEARLRRKGGLQAGLIERSTSRQGSGQALRRGSGQA